MANQSIILISGDVMATGEKSTYHIFCFILLLALLLSCETVFGSILDDDTDENEPPQIDLREILKVQTLELPILEGRWDIDGIMDEAIWEKAAHYEITLETYPALLEPSPVKTEVFIARIEDDLLVGFIAHDPNPEKIQAPLRDRDSIEFDDYVGFRVDLTGKLLTSYEFYVSARGVQADWVRNKVDDVRARDWDMDWESAATQGVHGYTVEMRIPLSELEVPIKNVRKRLLVFKRHYPREIRHHLSAITERKVITKKRTLKKRFIIVPSLTLLQERSRDAAEDTDWEIDHKSEFGIDLGYKIGPSFGLLATYNPNFLEVEADLTDWSINDPFTPLVVEKRPFFTRGSETFGTPLDLVYTRNIENPDAGIKVGGIVSDLTTGNFYVNDHELSLVVPGNLSSDRVDLDMYSQSGAFRYRYDFTPGMSAGAIVTTRTSGTDYHNLVGGMDIYARFNRENELRAQWVYSDTEYPDEIVNELCGEDNACDNPENVSGFPGISPLNESVLRADPTHPT